MADVSLDGDECGESYSDDKKNDAFSSSSSHSDSERKHSASEEVESSLSVLQPLLLSLLSTPLGCIKHTTARLSQLYERVMMFKLTHF